MPIYDADMVRNVYDETNQATKSTLATKIAGEDLTNDKLVTEQRFSTTYISTATTTTVKSGSGLLHTIVVNGGTAGTIIVYDNTAGSGTIIASFDSTNALATYTFNCTFATGLTVVTGAATKVTVNYR
jgi:hypothetical protein